MKTAVDVRRNSGHMLQAGVRALIEMLDESCKASLAVDERGCISWISDKSARFLGMKNGDEMLGCPVEGLIPSSRMPEVLRTGEALLLDAIEVHGRQLAVMRIPFKDASGVVIGALGLVLGDHPQSLLPVPGERAELQSASLSMQLGMPRILHTRFSISDFVGAGPAATAVRHAAHSAAQLDTTLLLQGEAGTGKKLLAHAIHAASRRAGLTFMSVSTEQLPENFLDAEPFGIASDGSTLFLDDVGELSLSMQAKLLRVLRQREVGASGADRAASVDVRLIAATRHDLKKLVAEGRFRGDLCACLSTQSLMLPPLRERKADLDLLCDHLLEELATRTATPRRELTPSARAALAAYDWPGNVGELAMVLEQACMQTDRIALGEEDIAPVMSHAGKQRASVSSIPMTRADGSVRALGEVVAEVERDLIRSALAATGGNKASAARMLRISRATLYQKIEDFGLDN